MSDVADRIKQIVVEHLGVEESKVTPEASFIDDLGADSLDTVELVMAFEEAFSVEIPEDAAEKIASTNQRRTPSSADLTYSKIDLYFTHLHSNEVYVQK